MIKALAVTGPTASGKTAVSIELAKHLDCEIISCDSMQVYRGMDIGTAKATQEERAEVPHHMLDFLSPDEPYSAGRYREDALACAEDIISRGRLPLFVGGTGLYIDTLMRGSMVSVPESTPEYREPLIEYGKTGDGARVLYERLLSVDPEAAAAMHMNNVKRVVRALEIYDKTGKPKSYFDKLSREAAQDVKIGMITLDFHNRENLYMRINERVDKMLDIGLVEETKRLMVNGFDRTATASSAIGYKELFPYINGAASLQECTEALKCASRRYAKRQLTWFKHNEGAKRVYLDGEDGTVRDISDVISDVFKAAEDFCKEMKI